MEGMTIGARDGLSSPHPQLELEVTAVTIR
jgi:hypothetical protein